MAKEIKGVAIARRFLERVAADDLATQLPGQFTVLPVLNPYGFACMRRRVFEDDQDRTALLALQSGPY